jgi:hypothetical protein
VDELTPDEKADLLYRENRQRHDLLNQLADRIVALETNVAKIRRTLDHPMPGPTIQPDQIEPTLRAMRQVRLMPIFTGQETGLTFDCPAGYPSFLGLTTTCQAGVSFSILFCECFHYGFGLTHCVTTPFPRLIPLLNHRFCDHASYEGSGAVIETVETRITEKFVNNIVETVHRTTDASFPLIPQFVACRIFVDVVGDALEFTAVPDISHIAEIEIANILF